ncbi:uncharacterized protein N7484_000643 [Penicillium longicatenatum]|uniref:uncharacterized protein n=1 Tax=Penicillium longicatenatum TaxID=1561947 RepID=UPI002548F084|nr:uncharacterized protein N7484_000643 [Penicillium longicatenatum]KAJ5661271.1 hypothetical protein N7484_000643 [Penicillium longicatenatum]
MNLITSRSLKCIESLNAGYESLTVLKQKKLANDELISKFCQPWHECRPVDFHYYSRAARVESIYLEGSELARKISLYLFEGDEASWEKTEEGKAIIEQIRAREQGFKIYAKRAEFNLNPVCGHVRDLFTTSKPFIGIGKVKHEDNYAEQSLFRHELIDQFQAQHPSQPWLWCPVLGSWEHEYNVSAVQLFPYMHGEETMNAIFGNKSSQELFSARNGILMSRCMEKPFKSGKLAIVPSNDSMFARCLPFNGSEYKIKVMDPTWELRDEYISSCHEIPTFGAFKNRKLTFGQLNDRKLVFRSSVRPAARYLFYSYCVQTMRSSWQLDCQNVDNQTTKKLRKKTKTETPFWRTSGCYIPHSMLRACVKELGRNYKSLLRGARLSPFQRASNQTLLETVVHQVKSRQPVLDTELCDSSSSGSDYRNMDDMSMAEMKAAAESRRYAKPPKKCRFSKRSFMAEYRISQLREAGMLN